MIVSGRVGPPPASAAGGGPRFARVVKRSMKMSSARDTQIEKSAFDKVHERCGAADVEVGVEVASDEIG